MTSSQSLILTDNPRLYSFFPFFYLAWADAVLLPSEISAIENYISEQKWLTTQEIDFLSSFLDPKNPPTPQELKGWQQLIMDHASVSEKNENVAEIGLKLSKLKGSVPDDDLRNSLNEIERMLGIVSKESVYHLRSNTPKKEHQEKINNVVKEVGKVVVGQQHMVNRLLIGLFTQNHVLLE